jgi:hypothetical protein
MMTSAPRLVFLAFLGLALGGCESDLPVQKLPELTFSHLPAITLNVVQVSVESEFTVPMTRPHIEHMLPTPPEKAMRRWAADRLRAAGSALSARFLVTDASFTEEELPVQKGIRGAFTVGQSARYEARVAATLEIVDDRGFRRGYARADARRSRTIPENATLNERDRMWFDLVDDVMKDFDRVMERNIRENLGAFVL